MNILDENVPASERRHLQRRHVRVRQIGFDLGRKGMTDEEIIPFLHHLRRPTFFTRDLDFYQRRLCNRRYCLVWLEIKAAEVAEYIYRLLHHQQFNTQAKRMGSIIGASPGGLSVWRSRLGQLTRLSWDR